MQKKIIISEKKFRKIMSERGLNIRSTSIAISVRRQSIYNWFGGALISPVNALKVCKLFNCKVETISTVAGITPREPVTSDTVSVSNKRKGA
jgi:hypothetical protein